MLSRSAREGSKMADDTAYKVEKRRRDCDAPEDEQIAEMVRIFAALTPDQRATVRALMQESDGKLREVN
jgi:hypothetical protein